MKVSPREARKARAFLYSHNKRGFGVKPRKFAAAAKELNVGFRELLRFIGHVQMGGQGQNMSRQELVRTAISKGA